MDEDKKRDEKIDTGSEELEEAPREEEESQDQRERRDPYNEDD